MKKIALYIFICFPLLCKGANDIISIDDFVNLAFTYSNDYEIYKIQKEINERNYKSSMHNFSYTLSLSLQPQYNHAISPITQPNGSVINHDITSKSVAPVFSFSTPIELTGGTFSFGSNFSYNHSQNGDYRNTSYSTNLYHFTYYQPLKLYNSTKWDKKAINANYILSEYESVASYIKLKAKFCSYYFDALKDQSLIDGLNQQIESLDTLVIMYTEQYKQGKIIKVELDDILFSQIDAIEKRKLYQSRLNYSIKELHNHLKKGYSMNTFNLKRPSNQEYIDYNNANIKLKRKQNEYDDIALIPWKKRLLESKYNRGIQMTLNTGFGMNSSSETLSKILEKKSPNISISISAKVPISDFKEKENQYKIAKLQWKQFQISTETQDSEEENELEQLVEHYNYLINNINFLKQKEEHINEEIAVKLELLKSGKILYDEYNYSYQKLLNNINDMISAFDSLYSIKCKIELLTLYDFTNNYDYRMLIKNPK